MPNGAQKGLPVSGTAHEFNAFSSVISQRARGFVTWDTLEWLGEEVAYNALYVTVAENGTDAAHVERVRNDVIDRFLFDGNLQVVEEDKADVILIGELIGYELCRFGDFIFLFFNTELP